MGGSLVRHFDRFANLSPAVKAPPVGESLALPGLGGLDAAHVGPLKENARAVRLLDEGEVLTVRAQFREALNEILHGDIKMGRDRIDFVRSNDHIARPPAAVPATLAEIGYAGAVKRHEGGKQF